MKDKHWGMARSLWMYYGIPFRGARLSRFYAEFIPPGSLCFDIGAHVGSRIRAWRKLGASVVAVEPQIDFVGVLEKLYGVDSNEGPMGSVSIGQLLGPLWAMVAATRLRRRLPLEQAFDVRLEAFATQYP